MKKVLIKKWVPAQYPKGSHSANCHLPEFKRLSGTGCYEDSFSIKGTFLSWGNSYEELRDGIGQYTTGLIMLDDGTITEVLPSNFKFVIDEQQQKVETAAIDLLEALKELKSWVCKLEDWKGIDPPVELALSAIKKAT